MRNPTWQVFLVYYEPTQQWEEVFGRRDDAERRAEELGDGYEVLEAELKAKPHLAVNP